MKFFNSPAKIGISIGLLYALVYLSIFGLLSLLPGCGSEAVSDSTYASQIPGGKAGTTCYAIYSNGAVVSGSCVKD